MDTSFRSLADELAIQKLTARYAQLGDRGFSAAGADSAALAELFTEDGVWQSGDQVRLEGRAAIAAGLARSPVTFVVHMLVAPLITVQGEAATGDWKAILMLTGQDGQSRLGASHYHIQYRRTADGWRICQLRAGAIAWAASSGFIVPA